MKRKICATGLLLLCCFLLISCNGVSGSVCTNCTPGDATVSFVLTATPPAPTSGLSIQAFTATITGITLTSATGAAVNVPLNSSSYIAEFTRVTSDSTVLAANVTVPAGTYTQIKISFSAPSVTFCTQPNPGVAGCAVGTLTSIAGSPPAATITISSSFTFAANQQTGIALTANLGTALTFSGQTISIVNLAAPNVFAAAVLPPTSTQTDLAGGQLSHVDDVMGLVTNAVSPTLTIHTSTRGDITATANSSTQFSGDCGSQTFSCIQVNSVAIVDTVLNSDGTFTLTFYQPVSSSSVDLVEGVVTSVPDTLTNQFTMVVTDRVFANTGSILSGQVNLGDQIVILLNAPTPFQIISKGLFVPAGSAFENSTSVASILPGQTLALPVLSFTAQSGAVPGAATARDVSLRFTRITATMSTSTSPVFNATNFPPYFGITIPQQFQTTTGRLSLDGVADLTSISSGSTFSTSALFIGPAVAPQFSTQSVRAH
jgi:hypothetical protein